MGIGKFAIKDNKSNIRVNKYIYERLWIFDIDSKFCGYSSRSGLTYWAVIKDRDVFYNFTQNIAGMDEIGYRNSEFTRNVYGYVRGRQLWE